jgi:pyridoxamine 5'-phosphate oxidase
MSNITEHISKLREDFIKGTLSESDVNANPFTQFETWFTQAIHSQVKEPQAMVLSTCTDDKPSSRIVYLRELQNNQFWFYGNFNSRKAIQLSQNANASFNFFWPDLERQIRIEGTVSLADPSYSDNYFNNRPHESKLGAWASDQSAKLSSRKELEDKLESVRKQFEGKEIPRPDFWGGWVLTANYYEFWQGRKSRLHDRISYHLQDNGWKIERLAP